MADQIQHKRNLTLIALDIAKKHHDAKVQYPSGKCVFVRIENTLDGYQRLLGIAKSTTDSIKVGFEPTSDYHRNIAYWMQQKGIECHLVSSLSCARAREMLYQTWDKNDRKDSSVILYLLQTGMSHPFYDPLVNDTMDIQEISNAYHQITIARTRCLNSLVNHNLTLYFPEAEQFLHNSRAEWFCKFLLKFPIPYAITRYKQATFVKRAWDLIGRKQYKQAFLEHLYEIAQQSIALPVDLNSHAVSTYKMQLARYIELSKLRVELEKQSETFLHEREDYQRLRTIPGVGAIIALIIIAESGQLSRFSHYRQYLNYCGFNLSSVQSGQRQSAFRLSKRGNARLRYAYWLAATVAIRQRENSFRAKYERYIRQNGASQDSKRKAYTAVAAKLARVAHAVVKKNVDYHGYFEVSQGT
ncbi:IS110 family transposase [Aestuariibacter salexigens]|uniref:IS110 family transposase n=1 Tax=Aestuariibacter salexigens TaxID=226010 RepID=UPI0003FF8582|nr:IS110 family transposase [Aestuariibacter salexigens]